MTSPSWGAPASKDSGTDAERRVRVPPVYVRRVSTPRSSEPGSAPPFPHPEPDPAVAAPSDAPAALERRSQGSRSSFQRTVLPQRPAAANSTSNSSDPRGPVGGVTPADAYSPAGTDSPASTDSPALPDGAGFTGAAVPRMVERFTRGHVHAHTGPLRRIRSASALVLIAVVLGILIAGGLTAIIWGLSVAIQHTTTS